MYKLIAIDVDDTLITDEKLVTEGTKRALEQAVAQGVHVTLATGRMYASARKIALQTGLNVPLITYQGSLIKNIMDGEVLYERAVPNTAAQKLLQYCTEHNVHLQLYVNDLLYAREENDKLIGYSQLNNIPYVIEPDFDKLLASPSTKMLMIDEPARLDEIAPELRELLGSEVHITKSKPHFLEVTHHEGTKGNALRFLADHFGCSIEETIGIGDSWNDHDLIEVAGLGVAMENAVDSLKQVANYVTLSNNEEGVRHVIEKFVLQTSKV
ncbi:Cof-type HAD-IIB family hydrolase [Paenibacillus sp. ACRRX]|uniref:Cof-type HAD-IIB family hydrolase n=1 Tax=unclassified Paenibacillus TaxID=185978 RepID=UPI001EF5CEA9|nr:MULTISPECIES: Cof-type HAD-IIB family hydrolase [unclassified Paenibacillus]MCG7409987.1 Cof-type HAD-IIB family hydrolase [Paenibacillus sp. ACRRX]MDK8182948.1 Cof-type HAD-IIB family hydrolase [Paenibacillus sp. UMB4589-SE434]